MDVVSAISYGQAVELFRQAPRGEGGMMLRRRELLTRILVGTGVALSAPIIEAASAVASPLELDEKNLDEGLASVTRRIYKIGEEHMQFHADPDQLMAEAVAAWRDALAYKQLVPSRSVVRASDAEALAAGLVAQFHGDRGRIKEAQAWYSHAWGAAYEGHVKAWLVGCQVWIPLYAGNGEIAVKVATRARDFQSYRNPERIAFTQLQLARAYALNGDLTKARRSFWEAEGQYEKVDIHRDTPPNLLHLTQWQFYQYASEVMGSVGKFNYARNYKALAFQSPHLNGMNRAVMELCESSILLAEGDAASAASHAISTVQSLKRCDATSAVVRGRVDALAANLRKDYGNIGPVRDVEEFAASLAVAA